MKRKIAIVAFVLCFCFRLMSFGALAASTADAVEPMIPEKECSLSVSYCYGETAFSDLQVKLYKVAEVSEDLRYAMTQVFVSSGLELNGIQNAGEWNIVRSTLEAYILANGVEADAVLSTAGNGQVRFEKLSAGMYFAVVSQATQDDLRCRFDSALVSLPGLAEDGSWQYSVSVNAKAEVLPPVDADEETELKVLKLWKGDDDRSDRPESVEVDIFRDGIRYETVVLSEENHWSYSWMPNDADASWTVIEKMVPQGYTMTVEEKGASFILTNTRVQTQPDNTGDSPQTGDTSNMLSYALIMAVFGTCLIIFGVTRKRTSL